MFAAAALVAIEARPGDVASGSKSATTGQPAAASLVLTTLSAALAIAALWAGRRAWLRWLSRRPGPIAVPDLGNATGSALVPESELSALFRRRLAQVGLAPPSAVPASTAPTDFLPLLRLQTKGAKGVLAAVAGALDAALPGHALRVVATLNSRESDPRCGVVVQVATLPQTVSSPEEFWAATWAEAVEQAAYWAAAYILPRTRRCRRTPWAAWDGLELPAGLVQAYVEGDRLVAQRRYDEALDRYLTALDFDPMNIEIRLELASLQEKLALWMDALDTYERLLDLACRARGKDEASWRPRLEFDLPTRAARRRARRAIVIARYRRAILLGAGHPLAAQWEGDQLPPRRLRAVAGRTVDWTHRDDERNQLCKRLETSFRTANLLRCLKRLGRPYDDESRWLQPASRKRREAPLAAPAPDEASAWHSVLGRGAIRTPRRSKRYWWLREAIQVAAHDELCRLYRDRRKLMGFSRRAPTKKALRVAIFWVAVRAYLTQRTPGWRWACTDAAPHDLPIDRTRRLRLRAVKAPDIGRLENDLDALVPSSGPRRSREWQEHYNAACLLALPIDPSESAAPGAGRRARAPASWPTIAAAGTPSTASPRRHARRLGLKRARQTRISERPDISELDISELPNAAVKRLLAAAASTDSGYTRSRRSWVLSEDPDFDTLRTYPVWREFEATLFPSAKRTPATPMRLRQIEHTRYLCALLAETGTRMERIWLAHAIAPASQLRVQDIDIHGVRELWQRECRTLRHVGETLVNFRDSATRLQLLCTINRWCIYAGMPPLELAFPRYRDQPHEDARLDEATQEEIADAETILQAMRELIDGRKLVAGDWAYAWRLEQLDFAATPLSRDELTALARCRVQLWHAFAECFTPVVSNEDARFERAERLANFATATRDATPGPGPEARALGPSSATNGDEAGFAAGFVLAAWLGRSGGAEL